MSLDPALRQRIEQLLSSERIVLFMKGDPDAPQCGFSAQAAGTLDIEDVQETNRLLTTTVNAASGIINP